ncbi:hypothetical protein L195_g039244 [Trifolium pratense]|uniref:Uncharacterized protein n=1 Tax=Trifolium pratense TaxID=57577 RepID=A0A2K3LXE6_TRIPR|nr:hypothetical protein L195_g039244 [Trifolium pratense]
MEVITGYDREGTTGLNRSLLLDIIYQTISISGLIIAREIAIRWESMHSSLGSVCLLEEAKVLNTIQGNQDHAIRSKTEESSKRYAMQRISVEQKKGEDDADMHLARNIMQNKQFKVSTQADDEYDFEDGPSRKSRKKQGAAALGTRSLLYSTHSREFNFYYY